MVARNPTHNMYVGLRDGSSFLSLRVRIHARVALWHARGLASALFVVALAVAPAVAAVEIDVDERQNVTLTGRSESLRQVLTDLFTVAEVEVREFGVSDRPVAVDYDQLPLHRVLERLLHGESYVVGLRGVDDTAIVSWVKVFGPESSGQTASASVAVRSGDFGVDPDVLELAWSSANAMERAKSVNKILQKVRSDPEVVEGFLDRDTGALADEISGHPFVVELLNAVRRALPDIVTQLKIDALVRTVRLRKKPPNKGLQYKLQQQFKAATPGD